jgi:hypothetical protein
MKRLTPFTLRQYHLNFGLRLKDHNAVLHPLLLFISKHEMLPHQLLLSIILSDDDSYEKVLKEEVAYDHCDQEK